MWSSLFSTSSSTPSSESVVSELTASQAAALTVAKRLIAKGQALTAARETYAEAVIKTAGRALQTMAAQEQETQSRNLAPSKPATMPTEAKTRNLGSISSPAEDGFKNKASPGKSEPGGGVKTPEQPVPLPKSGASHSLVVDSSFLVGAHEAKEPEVQALLKIVRAWRQRSDVLKRASARAGDHVLVRVAVAGKPDAWLPCEILATNELTPLVMIAFGESHSERIKTLPPECGPMRIRRTPSESAKLMCDPLSIIPKQCLGVLELARAVAGLDASEWVHPLLVTACQEWVGILPPAEAASELEARWQVYRAMVSLWEAKKDVDALMLFLGPRLQKGHRVWLKDEPLTLERWSSLPTTWRRHRLTRTVRSGHEVLFSFVPCEKKEPNAPVVSATPVVPSTIGEVALVVTFMITPNSTLELVPSVSDVLGESLDDEAFALAVSTSFSSGQLGVVSELFLGH